MLKNKCLYLQVLLLNTAKESSELFRFLNEYGDITIERFSIILANITTYRAERKFLLNMASAGVLDMFEQKGIVCIIHFRNKNS